MTTTILLADDHALFREGLAVLVGQTTDWHIVGQASDGAEAVQLAEALRPQIAVLDVEMPQMNGLEAARQIRQVSPATRIIALSMYGDVYYRDRMFEAGASAYVLKSEAMDGLVAAIEAVLRGQRYVSPAAWSTPPTGPRRSAEVDKGTLSDRERDVLRLLAAGQRTKEIAERLNISAKTVETYRSRIMVKLGIDNLPGLVKFAIRAGLVLPEP
jgi:DNA-binding NarL/FixJ family response regulator